jgi:hypothetical protein
VRVPTGRICVDACAEVIAVMIAVMIVWVIAVVHVWRARQ